jgi:hypothetical protein
MEYHISLEKMRSRYGTPIEYFLSSDRGEIRLNELIGQEISLIFSGSIHCVICGKSI